jgi:Bacterial Ig domain
VKIRPVAALLAVAGVLAFSLAGASPAVADPIPPGSVLDQSALPDGVQTCTSGNTSEGQSFTAGVTGLLTAVQIYVLDNPDSATTIQIEATSAGLPNGTVLATGTFTGAYQGVVDLAVPLAVTAGTVYALVMPVNLSLECPGGNVYAGGTWLDQAPASAWTSDPAFDLAFGTYVNSFPVATGITAVTAANTAVTIPLSEEGTVTSRTIDTAPSHGTATFAGATVIYTPAVGYSGQDSFSYHATNATGDSAIATITVTVTAAKPALASTGTDAAPWLFAGAGLMIVGAILLGAGSARRRTI